MRDGGRADSTLAARSNRTQNALGDGFNDASVDSPISGVEEAGTLPVAFLAYSRFSCIRNGISCAPCREAPWRRLPLSIRARPQWRAFFSAGALASVLVASVLAGAAVCANAEPINSSEAMAVAVARNFRRDAALLLFVYFVSSYT